MDRPIYINMQTETVEIGTEIKYACKIKPIDGLSIGQYDFYIESYCNPGQKVITTKEDAIMLNDNSVLVCVDSNIVGVGQLKCKVVAYIPDSKFPDGLRTEIKVLPTPYRIVRTV